jgi:hypothetical protein
MKLKIHNVSGYQPGSIISVDDIDGVPAERFWRNRLKDAKIDNCVEIVKPRAQRKREGVENADNC